MHLYGNGTDTITLYKSVNPENDCDFYTGKIKYEGVVQCPDFDPDENIECGNGLHLSPTASNARKYDPSGKILECEVNIDDIAVFSRNISKVRCRKVVVKKTVGGEMPF